MHRRGRRKEQHENQDARNLYIMGNRNGTFITVDSTIDKIYIIIIFIMSLSGETVDYE